MVWSEAVVHWTATALAMVAQVVQEATFEDNEYKPAAQGVHVVAPAPAPVFVMEPALHEAHKVTFENNENEPGAQRVQLVAPVPAPVFVMEPASHVWQEASPGDP